jgi:ferredoxin
VEGDFFKIPDFRMPVTFLATTLDEESLDELRNLYPPNMMATRTEVKPVRDDDKCSNCGDCETNCPPEALTLEPDFHINDECIACYCCVELCSEGAMEVPDVEAYRHY